MKTPPDNRRHACRYGFVTPLRWWAAGNAAGALAGAGKTLDISASGMWLELDRALPEGTRLDLRLEWPGLFHGRPGPTLLRASAEVVRTQQNRIGVRLLEYEFHTARGMSSAA